MKTIYKSFLTALLLGIATHSFSQENKTVQQKSTGGNYQGVGSLNMGLLWGLNSYNSFGFEADYEFLQLGQDFTLAAYGSYSSWTHKNSHEHGSHKHGNVGLGVRFRWYADRVLGLNNDKWDIFASGDVGFKIKTGKYKDSNMSPLLLGIGVGAKFHLSQKVALQAIIGSSAQIGVTIGL